MLERVRARGTDRRRSAVLAALAVTLAPLSCKTPEEHRADADRAAYDLVKKRREDLALGNGGFTIEPDQNNLRHRILRGEATLVEPLSLARLLEIAAENSRDFQTRKETLY